MKTLCTAIDFMFFNLFVKYVRMYMLCISVCVLVRACFSFFFFFVDLDVFRIVSL